MKITFYLRPRALRDSKLCHTPWFDKLCSVHITNKRFGGFVQDNICYVIFGLRHIVFLSLMLLHNTSILSFYDTAPMSSIKWTLWKVGSNFILEILGTCHILVSLTSSFETSVQLHTQERYYNNIFRICNWNQLHSCNVIQSSFQQKAMQC